MLLENFLSLVSYNDFNFDNNLRVSFFYARL
jgi:hypothetical protein